MEHSESIQCRSRLELDNLLGTWVNVNARADFITCFMLTFNGEVLKLTILSASRCNELQTHLDVHPVANPGSDLATGFYLYRQPSELIVAANEKNGVLVLQSYRESANAVKNNNQTEKLLSREFYYRQSTLQLDEDPPLTGQHLDHKGPINKGNTAAGLTMGENFLAQEDFQALPGCWHNTYCHSSWMKAFSIEKRLGDWVLEVFGDCNGVSWPKMLLTPYSFDQLEMGFIAYCDLDSVSGLFCAYSNKGLLVVTVYLAVKHTDPKQLSDKTFCREFYVKQSHPDVADS